MMVEPMMVEAVEPVVVVEGAEPVVLEGAEFPTIVGWAAVVVVEGEAATSGRPLAVELAEKATLLEMSKGAWEAARRIEVAVRPSERDVAVLAARKLLTLC
jgi:hypothetical protein